MAESKSSLEGEGKREFKGGMMAKLRGGTAELGIYI